MELDFDKNSSRQSLKSSMSSVWASLKDSCLVHVSRRSDIVRWFMPSWFTICMGTGVLASGISRIPYEIPGVYLFGCILFFFNILILAVLICIQASQLVIHPQIVFYMRSHPRRMLHYGAISMAMGTVVTGIASYQFAMKSAAVLYIGWGLWWVSVVLALASSILLVYLLVSKQTQSIESVTGAWLLLAAPLTVCAASGATIAEYLPTNLALITITAGYFLLGAGMPLACCLLVLYVHRITVYKLPSRDTVLTSFIPLGPISQMGVASITLGRIAQEVVPVALPHIEALGVAMFHVGIISALVAWGCALFALAHAVFSVVYEQRSSKIPFTISWWALVFPIGVFSRLTVDLSQTLQLGFFRVVHLLLLATLLALWLFNVVRTVVGIWTGSIFGIAELTEDCECCACRGDGMQKPAARASGCEDSV